MKKLLINSIVWLSVLLCAIQAKADSYVYAENPDSVTYEIWQYYGPAPNASDGANACWIIHDQIGASDVAFQIRRKDTHEVLCEWTARRGIGHQTGEHCRFLRAEAGNTVWITASVGEAAPYKTFLCSPPYEQG